jgi:hypothetical protein
MPLDLFLITKLAPLDVLTLSDVFADPTLMQTVSAAMSDDRPYQAPKVAVREERIGPDSRRLRIYTPSSTSEV